LKSRTGEFTIYGGDYNTGDGTGIRDYVHVDEICNSIKLSLQLSNQLECLGHGKGYTVKEMVTIFESINNCKIDVKIGPKKR